MPVDNDYATEFEITDISNLINPFIANPGYWEMYIGYILSKNFSLPDGDGLTTGPISAWQYEEWYISPWFLPILQKVFIVQIETRSVIYLNLYVAL